MYTRNLDLGSLCDDIAWQRRDNRKSRPVVEMQTTNQTERALTSLHQARHESLIDAYFQPIRAPWTRYRPDGTVETMLSGAPHR